MKTTMLLLIHEIITCLWINKGVSVRNALTTKAISTGAVQQRPGMAMLSCSSVMPIQLEFGMTIHIEGYQAGVLRLKYASCAPCIWYCTKVWEKQKTSCPIYQELKGNIDTTNHTQTSMGVERLMTGNVH